MPSFINSILLGVTLAAPVGPVGTEVIKRGFKQGFWSAYIVAIGSVFGDALCLLISYLGLAHVLQNPLAKVAIWTVGSLMLLYLAFANLMASFKPPSTIQTNQSKSQSNSKSAFFLGVLLAIANPLSMTFWFGIFGAVIGETVDAEGFSLTGLFSHMGILIGVFLWFSFLCILVSIGKRLLSHKLEKLNARFSQLISGFAGLTLLFFGVSFAVKAVQGTLSLIG